MPLADLTQERTQPGIAAGRYFRATVMDTNDPEKLQRVKVNVVDFFGSVPEEDLPWAMPFSLSGGNAEDQGRIRIPAKGTTVWVSFVDGNVHAPVYHGAASSGKIKLKEYADHEDYPHIDVDVDEGGNLIEKNYKKKTMKLVHVSGTEINIGEEGDVTVKSKKGMKFESQEDIEFASKKGIKFEAQEDIELTAKEKVKASCMQDMELSSAMNIVLKAMMQIKLLANMGVTTMAGTGFATFEAGDIVMKVRTLNIDPGGGGTGSGVSTPDQVGDPPEAPEKREAPKTSENLPQYPPDEGPVTTNLA